MWLVDVRPSGMCHQSMFDSEISPGQPQKDGSTSWPGVGDPGVPIFYGKLQIIQVINWTIFRSETHGFEDPPS